MIILVVYGLLIRPTILLLFLPILFYFAITFLRKDIWVFFRLLSHSIFFGIISLICFWMIDVYCYGKFVFPFWEFLRFNFFSNGANHFGTNHPLWYLFNGLLTILFTQTSFFLFGLFEFIRNRKNHKQNIINLSICSIILIIVMLSSVGHKEFRFLNGINSLLILINSIGFQRIINKFPAIGKFLLTVTIISNVVLYGYVTLFHQRAPMSMSKYLHNLNEENTNMRMLTCNPPPNVKSNSSKYIDEADQFFRNPLEWFDGHRSNKLNGNTKMNLHDFTHVVMFENLFTILPNEL
ncbi:hypothetical protein SNEBB_004943 [Seison nebaliae]|nr:hypothetical protein SNEBB_004943 [Seison nebaliae]